jgi:hypothetical protein
MATNSTRNGNGRNGNGNGRNGNGARKPVVTLTVRPATAADHAMAARDYGRLAARHASEAARLSMAA